MAHTVPEHLRTSFWDDALVIACHRHPEDVAQYLADSSYQPGSRQAAEKLYSTLGARLGLFDH